MAIVQGAVHRPFSSHSSQRCVASLVQISRMPCPELSHLHPAHGNDWCMLWGPQVWLKQKPYADYAYQYSFKEGEAGKLVLEFYITPLTMRMPTVPNYLALLY